MFSRLGANYTYVFYSGQKTLLRSRIEGYTELATYSNNESFVWTHTSIFETLWIKSELYSTNRILKE